MKLSHISFSRHVEILFLSFFMAALGSLTVVGVAFVISNIPETIPRILNPDFTNELVEERGILKVKDVSVGSDATLKSYGFFKKEFYAPPNTIFAVGTGTDSPGVDPPEVINSPDWIDIEFSVKDHRQQRSFNISSPGNTNIYTLLKIHDNAPLDSKEKISLQIGEDVISFFVLTSIPSLHRTKLFLIRMLISMIILTPLVILLLYSCEGEEWAG